MAVFSTMSNLEVWYAHADIDQALQAFASPDEASKLGKAKRKDPTRAQKLTAKAKTRTSLQAFNKMTVNTDGSPEFLSQPPLLVPFREIMAEDQTEQVWGHALRRRWRLPAELCRMTANTCSANLRLSTAHTKIVGVGSVGLRAWVLLLLGRDSDDPLVLQVKQSQQSVLEPFTTRSKYRNHGQRVVNGQRLQQAFTDIFLVDPRHWP